VVALFDVAVKIEQADATIGYSPFAGATPPANLGSSLILFPTASRLAPYNFIPSTLQNSYLPIRLTANTPSLTLETSLYGALRNRVSAVRKRLKIQPFSNHFHLTPAQIGRGSQ